MNHSINAVRKIHHSLVHPSRHGIRVVAVMLAMIAGLAGNFMEFSHSVKELEVNQVVEQIHSTLERREAIKELKSAIKAQ